MYLILEVVVLVVMFPPCALEHVLLIVGDCSFTAMAVVVLIDSTSVCCRQE